MYSVSPAVAALWHTLLDTVIADAGSDAVVLDHQPPALIDELWSRNDLAAAFMCGLPISLCDPMPMMVAAPVPSPAPYEDLPRYWSEFVVRRDSRFHTLEQTFGTRIALTVNHSQSGYAAALEHLMQFKTPTPLYEEIIAPQFTPVGALTAVVEGRAEIAPVDSWALALLSRHRSDLTARIRVVAVTRPTAIPALVASLDQRRLQVSFLRAHLMPALDEVREKLLISRFVKPDPAGYRRLREQWEAAAKYWRTRPLARQIPPALAIP
jgi:ABC-type phosphate/phosphonate transport system substrate-binding protein